MYYQTTDLHLDLRAFLDQVRKDFGPKTKVYMHLNMGGPHTISQLHVSEFRTDIDTDFAQSCLCREFSVIELARWYCLIGDLPPGSYYLDAHWFWIRLLPSWGERRK